MQSIRISIVAALACIAAACGKSGAPGATVEEDPVVKAALAQPVKSVKADDLGRAAATATAAANRHESLAKVVEQLADLGRPTLVDPEEASTHELTWAIASGEHCDELTVFTADMVHVDLSSWDIDAFAGKYWACVDASRGMVAGRRFEAAPSAMFQGDTSEAKASEVLAKLGGGEARDEKDRVRRIVRASKDERRCLYAIATVESGKAPISSGGAAAGTPRYAACSDWAAGKPTDLWAEDLR